MAREILYDLSSLLNCSFLRFRFLFSNQKLTAFANAVCCCAFDYLLNGGGEVRLKNDQSLVWQRKKRVLGHEPAPHEQTLSRALVAGHLLTSILRKIYEKRT